MLRPADFFGVAMRSPQGEAWWRWRESNPRPTDVQEKYLHA